MAICRPDKLAVLTGMLVLCLLAGCGYYGTSSRTAKDIKSVHVPFFENLTAEPNLEITVTERIIDNLIFDNTLDVVSDENSADAVLTGQIVEFINRPFSFNSELNAEEYHVVVKVKISLFNRRTNEPIWTDQVISGDGSYYVDVTDEKAQTFDSAVDESITEITERILNLTVQDW
jgi:outer membrane lipopolysaccharide assembly protein LptE/RlpB